VRELFLAVGNGRVMSGWKVISSTDQRLIQWNELPNQTTAGERLFCRCTTGTANPAAQRLVADKFFDSGRKGAGITRCMHERINSGRDDLGRPTSVTHDKRFAACHGFGNHKTEWFRLGTRVNNDVQRSNGQGRVRDKSCKPDARAKIQPLNLVPELFD
jgi:hypothetical protein